MLKVYTGGQWVEQGGGGGSVIVDSSLSLSSINPVQNKVITSALGQKVDSSDIQSTYNSADPNPISGQGVSNALGTLDVASVGGSGSYISEISETDGKISATATSIDTTVTSGSGVAVSSGAVYTAVAACLKPEDVASTYSSSGTDPVNGTAITAAINTLDVSSAGGSGSYISEISETDGKISATATSIDTTVTSGSAVPVSSGAVYTAVSGCLKPSDVASTYSSSGTDPVNGTAIGVAIKGDTYPTLRAYDTTMTTSSPNFNTFTTPGRYYVSAAAFQNATNAPFGPTGAKSYLISGMSCTLLVEEIGNTGVRQTVYIQYRDIVMTRVNRTPDTDSTWTRWKSMNADFPIAETPSSADKLDLNSDAMKESNYIYIPSAYVANLLNCPITSGNVTIRIETRRVSTSGSLVSVRQEVRGDTAGVFYERNGTTSSGVTTWTNWFVYSGTDTGS